MPPNFRRLPFFPAFNALTPMRGISIILLGRTCLALISKKRHSRGTAPPGNFEEVGMRASNLARGYLAFLADFRGFFSYTVK